LLHFLLLWNVDFNDWVAFATNKEHAITNIKPKRRKSTFICFHVSFIVSKPTCPFHGAKFNVASGKKISEPVLTPSQEMEPLPKTWQKAMEHTGQLMSHIKTYDQPTYEIKVGRTIVKAKI
jgi:nitrite reductase/ring-hydroxylating ferredoxin subunit